MQIETPAPARAPLRPVNTCVICLGIFQLTFSAPRATLGQSCMPIELRGLQVTPVKHRAPRAGIRRHRLAKSAVIQSLLDDTVVSPSLNVIEFWLHCMKFYLSNSMRLAESKSSQVNFSEDRPASSLRVGGEASKRREKIPLWIQNCAPVFAHVCAHEWMSLQMP